MRDWQRAYRLRKTRWHYQIIRLDHDDAQMLRAVAKREGTTVAELVRNIRRVGAGRVRVARGVGKNNRYGEAVMSERDDDPIDFGEWIKRYPPPDLQELAQRYGGLSRVPVEEWEKFDRAKARWEALRRRRFER
jgi:hypothetical protein